MKIYIMALLIMIAAMFGTAYAQTAPDVKAIAYVGKTSSDCPACHTKNAEDFTAFLKDELGGEVVGVTLNRQTFAYDGLPSDVEAVPAYVIRVNGVVQHAEYGAGGMLARNSFKSKYQQIKGMYSAPVPQQPTRQQVPAPKPSPTPRWQFWKR